jgi:hypothetical protein
LFQDAPIRPAPKRGSQSGVVHQSDAIFWSLHLQRQEAAGTDWQAPGLAGRDLDLLAKRGLPAIPTDAL